MPLDFILSLDTYYFLFWSIVIYVMLYPLKYRKIFEYNTGLTYLYT